MMVLVRGRGLKIPHWTVDGKNFDCGRFAVGVAVVGVPVDVADTVAAAVGVADDNCWEDRRLPGLDLDPSCWNNSDTDDDHHFVGVPYYRFAGADWGDLPIHLGCLRRPWLSCFDEVSEYDGR